jgi:hypothetical protein
MIGLKKNKWKGIVDAIKPSDDASVTFKCRYFKLARLANPSESKIDTRALPTPRRKRQYHNG